VPVETIEVPVSQPYPVFLGDDLDAAGVISDVTKPGACVVLSDSNVGPLHAEALRRSLEDAGWRVLGTVEVRAGEASKGMDTYADVLGRLARLGLARDGTLFALGGGVVGDLGGFVAATFMRGVGLVMLPTSLLSMVDSSVGGKTGLDLPEGKNLVGSFVRPRAVVADTRWLTTLPAAEVSNGLAEVIKMGLLGGGGFFDDLSLIPEAREGDTEALRALIQHSISFKAAVVGEDELEGGRRAILNYGHTIGHALEAAADFNLPHGSAISAGMVAAARLSRSHFATDLVDLHEDLLHSADLPLTAPGVDVETALAAMSRDKKRSSSETGNRFVLLRDVGDPVYGVPVDDDEARREIGALVG
jgi:3-dehydroquinate synthase